MSGSRKTDGFQKGYSKAEVRKNPGAGEQGEGALSNYNKAVRIFLWRKSNALVFWQYEKERHRSAYSLLVS